ncbi:MAG TPA: LytTR family DNA-binding domain-containing protein [Thermoanaerobaculia bacterium]|nr:LytTR family DNA-binding domain-containing protein [Thermoanaerobaculia bacterium]
MQQAALGSPLTGSNAQIRAIIVDDEPLSRSRIRRLLEHENDIDVIGEYANPARARQAIAQLNPDLLFLDVEMPRATGFELLSSLRSVNAPATIFVTAHAQYAKEAFDSEAVDYLLKPFDDERFRRSLDRVRRQLRPLAVADRRPFDRFLRRLAVKSGGAVSFLRIDELDWLETAGNYVRLHAGKESHLHREALSAFELRLDPERFVRIHRSTVVNIDRIARLSPAFARAWIVELRDGTRLTLAAPYRDRLQALVGHF